MDMRHSSVQVFCVPQISCSIKEPFMPHLLRTLPFVCCYYPASVSVCVSTDLGFSLSVLPVYQCMCVSLSFSASPVGQLEGDSPIRAGPVVQRLSAVVSDTELSLSLNNCQSTLTPLAASLWATRTPLWTLIGSLGGSRANGPWPSFLAWPLTDWLDPSSLRHAKRAFNKPQGAVDWPGYQALWEHGAAPWVEGGNFTIAGGEEKCKSSRKLPTVPSLHL